MSEILIPVAAMTLLGGIFGIILAVASKVFYVKTDERVPMINEVLPGANCGGCGFSGCLAYASAIVSGDAKINACPVGGDAVQEEISKIMGVEANTEGKKVARVLCAGKPERTVEKYIYDGPSDCHIAARLGGGPKACSYGCLGYGTCENVCKFDAIHIVEGVAVVDPKKCTACVMCVKECPKKVIKLIDFDNQYTVLCNSNMTGKEVRRVCEVGCIGCKICEKACPKLAITVENNLAVINPSLCVNCGLCAKKCPQKTIEKV